MLTLLIDKCIDKLCKLHQELRAYPEMNTKDIDKYYKILTYLRNRYKNQFKK